MNADTPLNIVFIKTDQLRLDYVGVASEARMATPNIDRMFDPHEVHNLASDPSHQSILSELKARLHQHLKSSGDPIVDAPIPAPQGATH